MSKILSIVIGVFILTAIGLLAYTVAVPPKNERFTEFYVLGLMGNADSYPSAFKLDGSVQYGKDTRYLNQKFGQVILGIVNQEQKTAAYSVQIKMDGFMSKIYYEGQSFYKLSAINLEQGQKWENKIGFAPSHTGENQKVEFLLYKNDATEIYNSLQLWVSVN